MCRAEGTSIIGLQGTKSESIRLRVVKQEQHRGIAKATLAVVKKDRGSFFHCSSAALVRLARSVGENSRKNGHLRVCFHTMRLAPFEEIEIGEGVATIKAFKRLSGSQWVGFTLIALEYL